MLNRRISVAVHLRDRLPAAPGLVMVLIAAGLAGCGQKGPLVLPQAVPAGAAASSPAAPR